MLFLSPTAGAFADRFDKRRIIIATQIVATFASAAIAALVFLDWIKVWHLMVLATVSGIAFAFEVPTRQAFVNDMVGRDKLMNAIALNSALVNLSRIFGPAIAGVLMATVGMGFCFTLDALSYVVVTVTLLMLKLPPAQRRARTKSTIWRRIVSHLEELREGFVEAWSNRRVRVILTLLFVVGVFGWSFQTLMPPIASDLLRIGEMKYGALMSMFGIGAIVGALYTASRKPESNRRGQVFGGVWTMCVGVLLLALSGALFGSSAVAFWCVSGALVFAGFGAVLFISTGNTLVQTSVDDSSRGRIMGIWAVAFGGSLPLGNFLAGGVAEFISPYPTIALFAGVMLAASLAIYFTLPPRGPVGSAGAPGAAAPSAAAIAASSPERRQ
jgi:MFS family permease